MDPTCVFNFFTFFETIICKSNCIIFIFSWCATHTKMRSKLVVIVTAGSQKITLWGPQRIPLGILRVKRQNGKWLNYMTIVHIKWRAILYQSQFQELFPVPIRNIKASLYGQLFTRLDLHTHAGDIEEFKIVWFRRDVDLT